MTARMLAVRALLHQEQDGYANLVLDSELKKAEPSLEQREAAFAASIFYTTLEHQNLLDWLVNQYSKKPITKLDAPVRAVLRAGLAQARFMEVPLSAAVNESVKLTKQLKKTSAAGMVNAILRKAAITSVKADDFTDVIERLTVYYSIGNPVAKLLYDQYKEDAVAMVEAFSQPRATTVRVNSLKTTDAELVELLQAERCAVEPGPWKHCLQVKFAGSPAHTQAFKNGLFHVQGLTSQFAALCVEALPGQRVLDLCAAPGGKSLTMAEVMQDKGELISGEGIKSRVPLLKSNFDRCGIKCAEAIYNDASIDDEKLGQFDRVLCDVPCSGLGILGKKPDIRYKSLDGIDKIYELQQKILQNGAKHLAPNGRLVYSTCTVNYYENQAQIAEFLDKNMEYCVVTPDFVPAGAGVLETGTLFLPHKTGTDGFFVSILQRKG